MSKQEDQVYYGQKKETTFSLKWKLQDDVNFVTPCQPVKKL